MSDLYLVTEVLGVLWICTLHFGTRLFGCEHPVDAGAFGVLSPLPCSGLGDETGVAVYAAVEALAGEDADLDLDHVQPAGVLGDVVELQPAQHPSCFLDRECLVERTG
jgi:hypothetical protein